MRNCRARQPDIIAAMHGAVAEGVSTTKAAVSLARKQNVEMPIAEQVYRVLHEGREVREAVRALMGRELRGE